MTETPTQRKIMLALGSLPGVRIFRNNVGMGWAGRLVDNSNGRVTLENARPLHAGLLKGSGDLIGWKTVEVTADMVGTKLAVFTSVEVKREKGGRTSEAQDQWRKVVKENGGIAIIARSDEEALANIKAAPGA